MRPLRAELGEIVKPTSDVLRYFTFGEVVGDVPPIVPFEMFCAPIDQEPDPVSLVDATQPMNQDRRKKLEVVDYFLYATQVRHALGSNVTPDYVVSALKLILKPGNPDSWREASRKGYKNHIECMERAHERMAALGIPRNR